MTATRVGLIVPSSNTTMETEIPAMLRAREEIRPERFTFHSSRMRMQQVTPEQLRDMDDQSLRCARELADAEVDVMAYACLVAIMARSNGYHRESRRRLAEVAGGTPVVSSAGALVEGLEHLGAKKISVIAPYMKPLTKTVCDYIEAEGVEVHDSISLEVPDNLEVGRLDPAQLVDIAAKVDTSGVDALVLSACVQMPSLPVVEQIQSAFDIPVVTASVATVWRTLKGLGLDPVVPNAGWLLAARS
ncbi:aspartate/glutamate racemase family protein [Streptomyces sp. NPDC002917]|uniref:maleate cis-trans isomerase family protein n=1 Tax=unclassified Streptomyces TaxID=2593676 RepID=UPI002E80A127|nr:aspartate/glutamate racemase family protein [Streptomyces sp. NBC_00562]WTC83464.1 aspartate/glutamate racemase family protein [Streptomyces sp. NBC_01653]WTD31883.1 aspartate/glutamate racemase family protein [Streptomyces sp. NBC_01643]WTD87400.1 aspartate/glutamate racemase family protein [Streptomyces sp. NBC_01637]WUC18489.1 aspartate/glutamate racemase family protein [Streptomyces sp. NBC_00562]